MVAEALGLPLSIVTLENGQSMDQNTASRKVLRESQQTTFPYHISFEGLDIVVFKNVFSPKFFTGWKIFTAHFPDVKSKRVLEIGCGTGITSLHLARAGAAYVLAVDISKPAIENTRENILLNGLTNMETCVSDIFSGVRNGEKFDIIYWNLPFMYQPENYRYRSHLERGLFDPGYKMTERFLRESKDYLLPGGQVFAGLGNFGDVDRFMALAKAYGYSTHLIVREDSFEINPVDFQMYALTPVTP